MAALTAFYDLVMPHLPRCGTSLASQYILLAVQEFYARSLCKRVTLDDVTTAADDAEYALTLPEGFILVKPLTVWLDGDEIDPIGMDDRDALVPGWKSETDKPTAFYLPDTKNIGLFQTPDGAYTVSVEAALKPSSSATTLDDWVFDTYREGIASGALAKLMAMPKSPWSSNLSAYHSGKFESCIQKAHHAAMRGHSRAVKRTRPVFGVR